MESEEIKKGLECCSTLVDNNATSEEQDNSCNECPYRLNNRCTWKLDSDALKLINELESENERLTTENVNYYGAREQTIKDLAEIINKQKDRIAELEKENRNYYDRLNILQTYIDNHEEIWKGNTKNQLKQFAKRLKKVIHERDYVKGYAYLGICEEIDETLKEFIYG